MRGLTLCVPFYESEEWIGRYLESVAPLPESRVGFVFVDDGSTDRAAAEVRRFAASREGVELISFPENRGGGPAYNAAAAAATGGWVMRQDPDDVALPEGILAALDAAEAAGADVVLQPWLQSRDGEPPERRERHPARGATKWWLDVPPAPWVTMCRTALVRRHGVEFPSVPSAGDSIWFLHLMAVADPARVVFTKTPSYHYLLRPGSQGDQGDGRAEFHVAVHTALVRERERVLTGLAGKGLISEADLAHGMQRSWGKTLGVLLSAGRRREVIVGFREAHARWGSSWRMRRDALRAWLRGGADNG